MKYTQISGFDPEWHTPPGPEDGDATAKVRQIREGLSAELALTRPEHLRTAWHQMLMASVTVMMDATVLFM